MEELVGKTYYKGPGLSDKDNRHIREVVKGCANKVDAVELLKGMELENNDGEPCVVEEVFFSHMTPDLDRPRERFYFVGGPLDGQVVHAGPTKVIHEATVAGKVYTYRKLTILKNGMHIMDQFILKGQESMVNTYNGYPDEDHLHRLSDYQ